MICVLVYEYFRARIRRDDIILLRCFFFTFRRGFGFRIVLENTSHPKNTFGSSNAGVYYVIYNIVIVAIEHLDRPRSEVNRLEGALSCVRTCSHGKAGWEDNDF